MPIYFFWGEDSFARDRAVKALQTKALDPDWASFNLDKLSTDQPDAILQALNQAMTPPFGLGDRFVWLVDSSIAQRCGEDLLAELERTLPAIPATTTFVMTSASKPDGRLKSTKLLQKYAEIQEFSPIPPWKTDHLAQQLRKLAQELDLKLTQRAVDYLVEAVGNQTRQLHSELEKIRLLAGTTQQPLDVDEIAPIVTASNQNSLKLFAAIRQGQTTTALELVADLLRQNEPGLRIVSTLTGQFRQRLWIKLMLESGERDDRTIAQAADLGNPKQLYFLRQEVVRTPLQAWERALPLCLELEFSLKRGGDEIAVLQTKVIELCELFRG
ncbi:DNA polymerase III subunit delta [Alkalinema sp. FACHB-956]|uniref:DNA polymerase III subunit delta n=1 Tax=Alkalinema sp. FACHB-956 TaxID=2692768 RepID=UPI001688FDF2|nr:DNA polymerase III subunit delta [Alkalinema sp. FACHB-956]MBD2327413.1 DNA polymerase III subunit delta [Alkalinema sp. FACHB-956]